MFGDNGGGGIFGGLGADELSAQQLQRQISPASRQLAPQPTMTRQLAPQPTMVRQPVLQQQPTMLKQPTMVRQPVLQHPTMLKQPVLQQTVQPDLVMVDDVSAPQTVSSRRQPPPPDGYSLPHHILDKPAIPYDSQSIEEPGRTTEPLPDVSYQAPRSQALPPPPDPSQLPDRMLADAPLDDGSRAMRLLPPASEDIVPDEMLLISERMMDESVAPDMIDDDEGYYPPDLMDDPSAKGSAPDYSMGPIPIDPDEPNDLPVIAEPMPEDVYGEMTEPVIDPQAIQACVSAGGQWDPIGQLCIPGTQIQPARPGAIQPASKITTAQYVGWGLVAGAATVGIYLFAKNQGYVK